MVRMDGITAGAGTMDGITIGVGTTDGVITMGGPTQEPLVPDQVLQIHP